MEPGDRLNLPRSQVLHIADPNDAPYITAVGGTSFETPSGTILFNPGNNPHPHYPGANKEKVWITYPCNTKACDGGGSSGGVSRIWAEGDYAFDNNGKPLPGVDEPGYSKSGAYCGQQPGVLCRENPDAPWMQTPTPAMPSIAQIPPVVVTRRMPGWKLAVLPVPHLSGLALPLSMMPIIMVVRACSTTSCSSMTRLLGMPSVPRYHRL